MQLSCGINRTACRSILAGASSLVDSTNTMLAEVCTSGQCDENLAANSPAVRRFIDIEDMELSMIVYGESKAYAALSLPITIKTLSSVLF